MSPHCVSEKNEGKVSDLKRGSNKERGQAQENGKSLTDHASCKTFMNKTYSLPPVARIHFSSVCLLFPLYLSHAWLTSGGLNQHWKWPVLLDLPLSARPSLLHLILSALNTSFTAHVCQWWGFASPAYPAENPYSRVCWSYLPSVIKSGNRLPNVIKHIWSIWVGKYKYSFYLSVCLFFSSSFFSFMILSWGGMLV